MNGMELRILIVHAFVVMLVVLAITLLTLDRKLDGSVSAGLFGTALGFSGAKGAQVGGDPPKRNGGNNG